MADRHGVRCARTLALLLLFVAGAGCDSSIILPTAQDFSDVKSCSFPFYPAMPHEQMAEIVAFLESLR